jgi:precorrin-6B methylase 2
LLFLQILKSSGRIVIPAITLNTLKVTEEFIENNNFKDIGISLIAVSKFEKKGKSRMLKANYPVFVISGEKNG